MTKGGVDAARPETWPHRPLLPLLRGGGKGLFPELGLLVEGRGATVYLAGLFDGGLPPPDGCERASYASLGDVFASGWRID